MNLKDRVAERKTAETMESNLYKFNVSEKVSPDDIIELSPSEIVPYRDEFGEEQPFDIEPEDLNRLVLSIAENGQIEPIRVKKTTDGKYMILSGQRRWTACQKLSRKVKAVVVDIPTNKEFEYVCNANVYRLRKSPSSLAKVFLGYKRRGRKVSEISEIYGIDRRTYSRYMAINNCIPLLQGFADTGLIATDAFTHLQNLSIAQQESLAEILQDLPIKINKKKANLIEDFADTTQAESFSAEEILEIINPKKPEREKVSDENCNRNIGEQTLIGFLDEIKECFPQTADKTYEELYSSIITLLKQSW